MDRYAQMFKQLTTKKQGAFIPFVMLGDPTPSLSLQIIRSLIQAGADALELGIPYSDPIADGPVIQKAAIRARAAGVTPDHCWQITTSIRQEFPDIPMGLLTYANLVINRSMDYFYKQCAQAGIDSVLVADVPHTEAAPFVVSAKRNGIQPVAIAPPNASTATLEKIAALTEGYTYLLSRPGVTGIDAEVNLPPQQIIQHLKQLNAAPTILGFGVSEPAHIKAALAAGGAGAISGSAIVTLIEHHSGVELMKKLTSFVKKMKGATFEQP